VAEARCIQRRLEGAATRTCDDDDGAIAVFVLAFCRRDDGQHDRQGRRQSPKPLTCCQRARWLRNHGPPSSGPRRTADCGRFSEPCRRTRSRGRRTRRVGATRRLRPPLPREVRPDTEPPRCPDFGIFLPAAPSQAFAQWPFAAFVPPSQLRGSRGFAPLSRCGPRGPGSAHARRYGHAERLSTKSTCRVFDSRWVGYYERWP